MNNLSELPEDAEAEAQGRLGNLHRQVDAMRTVLVQLLQDVVHAERLLDRSQAAQLLEANEHLVVSALGAQTDAETANGALDEASRIATRDPLTGLPNRSLLLDRFDSAIAHAKRHGNRVALLFLDLDAFKLINDSLGHAAGDQALQLVADCLTSLVRETDTVSRHGGDEFLILLSEVAHAGDAAHVAGKVNALLSAHARVNDTDIDLTASIGISLFPEDGADAKTLIDRADAAMYRAKRQRLGGYAFHGDPIELTTLVPRETAHTESQPGVTEYGTRNAQLCDANEALVLAALGAQELLEAAESAKARQADLLKMVAKELNDPFAPVRVAAAALGMSNPGNTLLPQVQELIEEQAGRLSRMVRDVLGRQG